MPIGTVVLPFAILEPRTKHVNSSKRASYYNILNNMRQRRQRYYTNIPKIRLPTLT